MTNQKENISLYFKEGSSDKEYHVDLVPSESGFVVNFRYGRRGSALASGTKTASPVPFESAKKIFDKLVHEKTAKGYSPEVSGAAYQGTALAGLKTDFAPQLLNEISDEGVDALIENDDWAAQEKKDGERRAIKITQEGEVTGMNRKGLVVPLPEIMVDDIKSAGKRFGEILADGEIVGDRLYIFDLHVVHGTSVRHHGWLQRIKMAGEVFDGCESLQVIPVAITKTDKRALFNRIQDADGEGVVFKQKDAMVKPGRPNSGGDWLKFKFFESASCRVAGLNENKRSVQIEVADDSGKFNLVGNVTIPPNKPIPKTGAIIEVKYLYAYKGGSLFTPTYLGERTDLYLDACTTDQLKYKPEGQAEEDTAQLGFSA